MALKLVSLQLPQRQSLSNQAALVIRQAISEDTWTHYLPSERQLCRMFQISRPTVRTALHMLAKEGLIQISQGRRNRLLQSAPATAPRVRSSTIGLIVSEPINFQWSLSQKISEIRLTLVEQGFMVQVFGCSSGSALAQQRRVEAFIQEHDIACCILLSATIEVQQWFSNNTIPALVCGSCHPEVRLPSLDIDYRSVCRHASGLFLNRGHRNFALIIPGSGLAGDLASEIGFHEGVQQAPYSDHVHAVVVRHNRSAANLISRLDALFRSPHPPSALLVAVPHHVVAVMTYLLNRRLSVPGDVSLLSRDQDISLNSLIDHYAFQGDEFSRRLRRLVLQMAKQGHLPPEPYLIIPEHVAGRSIGCYGAEP